MKKQLVIIGIVAILVTVGLSGCIKKELEQNNINMKPTLTITTTTSNPEENELVEFYSNALDEDGEIISVFWDFGDGFTSDKSNSIHNYTTNGTYIVTCKVTDNRGASTFVSMNLTVKQRKIYYNTTDENEYDNCDFNPIFISLSDFQIINLTVTINGYVTSSEGTISKIKWDWGDGTIDTQWFPAIHRYKIKNDYNIYVTGLDNIGNEKTIQSKIRLLPETLLTINGNEVSFIAFPQSFFDGSKISPNRVVEIIDVFFSILKDAHNPCSYQGKISFYYSDEDCGAYSNSRYKMVTICKAYKPSGTHPWEVYIHEMSHNIVGQDNVFLHLVENGYSAFLDEHQAEINPEYVFQILKEKHSDYGLTENELNCIEMRNNINRNIQKDAYNNYIQNGKKFYIQQDNIEQATRTGQALSHYILELVDRTNPDSIKKFNRALKNDVLTEVGFIQTPTPKELINYITAAYSLAFNQNLSQSFSEDLNFPIENSLYDYYYNILEKYIL